MSARLWLVGIIMMIIIPACAARSAPPLRQPPPELLIPETLESTARICVVLDPFHYQTQFACMTVGALRATIRGRAFARLEVP